MAISRRCPYSLTGRWAGRDGFAVIFLSNNAENNPTPRSRALMLHLAAAPIHARFACAILAA
ncbi:MAG TPA: hypothetical protein VFQ52_09265 [Rhizomicrobium sp.]|nr:hypothetical protein [Rhizomicrobium sp.]